MKRHKVHHTNESGGVKTIPSPHSSDHRSSPRSTPAHAASPKPTHRKAKPQGFWAKLFSPVVTPRRLHLALGIALLGDALQLALTPFDLTWPGQAAGAALALAIVPALGFHSLLLLALVFEVVPAVNILPMWTVCAALVAALRKDK